MSVDFDKVNVDELLQSIESDKLLSMSKLSYDKINTIKYNVLTRIGLEDDELESTLLKLSDYRYSSWRIYKIYSFNCQKGRQQ